MDDKPTTGVTNQQKPSSMAIKATIIRANGRREELGTVSYRSTNIIKDATMRAIIRWRAFWRDLKKG